MKSARPDIVPATIESREPPQPDIACATVDGERLAFELVELCTSEIAKATAVTAKRGGGVGFLWTADPTRNALLKKISKRYASAGLVDLLCYVDGFLVTPDDVALCELRAAINDVGQGQFREVWFHGEGGAERPPEALPCGDFPTHRLPLRIVTATSLIKPAAIAVGTTPLTSIPSRTMPSRTPRVLCAPWPSTGGGRRMDLYQYFLNNNGPNINKNPHFLPIYERHFACFRNRAITLFEIGTGDGGSAQMWRYYFGPYARIVTIDIASRIEVDEPQIFPRVGDQSDTAFLASLLDEFGAPDIVIDDGSHMMSDIFASFEFLFPRMNSNGVYLAEDLDGAYWPARGGGFRVKESFIERCKDLIDEMNAEYCPHHIQMSPSGAGISGICLYPMVVVLEKSPFMNRQLMRRPERL